MTQYVKQHHIASIFVYNQIGDLYLKIMVVISLLCLPCPIVVIFFIKLISKNVVTFDDFKFHPEKKTL